MKIKNISIDFDAYISGTYVRDDGSDHEFMVLYGEYVFDRENSDPELDWDEERLICSWVAENIGREMDEALAAVGEKYEGTSFELEV